MSNLIENRHIRFFISSTFQDMHDERDYLMKHVFPELRIIAAKRNVTLTELDLRWGVTEEESKLGKVLGICLNEIENSIPFFIGIVGNRYGWCPTYNDVSKDVLERYNVVDSYLQRHLSITEMEIQYGVLERDEPMHAYFFIKDDQSKVDFEKAKELENLKNAIRNNTKGYPVLNYDTVETLGEFVKSYFIKLLDEVFPMKNISTIEKQHIIQRSIVNQLCQSYSANEFYFQFIDDWLLNNSEPVLVVFGESGMGKSALLANWIKRKENNHDEQSLFYHFIENTNNGTNYDAIQQTLCEGLCSKFGYKLLKSEEDNPLSSIFSRITTEGKSLVLVIDGLNQISNIANAKQLNWLPTPSGRIKILLSTIEEDKTFMTISRRHYQTLKLEPLTEDLKINLINNYLERYAKKLKPSQIIKIVKDPQCSNTLVLRTLLDELISFGVYEKIDERIAYYTGKKNIEDFYSAILNSYEDEFGRLLIRKILSLIAISRYGLSEDEILSLTSIRPFLWSQFYCSFNRNFRNQNGLISFSHKSIYNAVETRYLSGNADSHYREILHEWFSCSYNEARKMEEVPFQLYMMDDCDRLFLFLSEPLNFVHLFSKDYSILQSYWNLLQKRSSLKYPLTVYLEKKLGVNEDLYGELCHLAGFFISGTFFQHELSLEYYNSSLKIRLKNKGYLSPDTATTYNNMATEYLELKDYTKAFELYSIVLEIRKHIFGEKSQEVATTLNNIGTVYINFDTTKAYKYLEEAKNIRISIFGEKSYDVAISYNNIASIVLYQNKKPSIEDLNIALESVERAISILNEIEGEESELLAMFYHNLSITYDNKGEIELSIKYLLKSHEIHRKIYIDKHPRIATDYSAIGYLYYRMKQFNDAFIYYEKSISMYKAVNHYNSFDAVNTLGYIATTHYELGEYKRALKYFKEQLKILQELPFTKDINHSYSDLSLVYNNIGISYYRLGDQDNAIHFYTKAIELIDNMSKKQDVRSDYALYTNNLARAYFMKCEYSKSLKFQIQALKIQQELYGENDQDTARSYNNIGLIYFQLKNYNLADNYLQLAFEIRKSLPIIDNLDIADSYKNIGDLYKNTGRLKEAIISYSEAFEIYKNMFGRNDKRCTELKKLLVFCKLRNIL